ncbi:MAG: hypothetical protein ACFFHD_06600 [Promethearchaeota archaeon]
MKKYKVLLFFLALYFFAPLLHYSSSTIAWRNNSYILGWPSYYSSENYGTHDWIAETAITILHNAYFYEFGESPEFINKIVSNYANMKDYFLAGTEAPDACKYNSYWIETLCKNWIESKFIPRYYHKLRFDGSTEGCIQRSLCILAKELGQWVDYGFNLHDGQYAAYFLGAMCHAIADATFYTHLIDGTQGWQTYATNVQYFTSTPISQRITGQGFFSTNEAQNTVSIVIKIKPDKATEEAGRVVMFAKWGDYYDPYGMDYYYPKPGSTINQWEKASNLIGKPIGNWIMSDWVQIESDVVCYNYFKTIENHLNVAIFYCAAAINELQQYWKGYDCQPTEEDLKGHPPAFGNKEADANKAEIKVKLRQFEAFFAFGLTGTLLSLIALGLSLKTAKELGITVAPF